MWLGDLSICLDLSLISLQSAPSFCRFTCCNRGHFQTTKENNPRHWPRSHLSAIHLQASRIQHHRRRHRQFQTPFPLFRISSRWIFSNQKAMESRGRGNIKLVMLGKRSKHRNLRQKAWNLAPRKLNSVLICYFLNITKKCPTSGHGLFIF